MEFSAPWSDTLRLMSGIGSAVIVVAVTLAMLKRQWWLRVTALAVVVIFLGVSWGFAPSGYRVSPEELIVERPLGKVVIERSSITAVRLFEGADDEGMKRTAGNGGLFGYYGDYESKRLGAHSWYVTDMLRRVVVETGSGAIVVSPDDPKRFIEALKPSK
jgi:hypothetical protein